MRDTVSAGSDRNFSAATSRLTAGDALNLKASSEVRGTSGKAWAK